MRPRRPATPSSDPRPAVPAQRHPGTRPPSSSSRACSRGASGSCWVSAGCRGSRARAVAAASPRLVRRRRSRPRLRLALRIPVVKDGLSAVLVLSGGGVVFARPACLLFGWKVTGEDEQRRALVVMALVAAVRRKSHQPPRRQDAALQFQAKEYPR